MKIDFKIILASLPLYLSTAFVSLIFVSRVMEDTSSIFSAPLLLPFILSWGTIVAIFSFKTFRDVYATLGVSLLVALFTFGWIATQVINGYASLGA